MEVLHVTNNFPTIKHPIYGIFVKEQIDSLSEKGIVNEVFFINGREKGKMEYLKSIFLLKKKIRNKKYDIIHCHHALSALSLILSGSRKKSKIIVSFQNDPKYEMGERIGRFIIRNSDGWIFKNNSSFIQDKYAFHLPNGVNTELFKPLDKKLACQHLKLNPEKKYILFVSSYRIRHQKRYDRFKTTLNILKKNIPDIEEIKLINVKRDLMPYYFNATDVHLMTSDFEGSPNSVKECLACNTAVVSTDVGNVKELLDGVIGSYVSKTRDEKELAELVCQSLSIQEEEKMNGREMLLKKNLAIDLVADKMIEIYYDIMNKL
jgi:glycosyltransferase involved in cell wall biosynthesis